MNTIPASNIPQGTETEWAVFSGGELEGKRPRALCANCRDALERDANSRRRAGSRPDPLRHGPAEPGSQGADLPGGPVSLHSASGTARPLCFACYRASFERERTLRAAGALDTASPERFQVALPLEPVNRARLAQLKLERGAARMASRSGAGRFVDKRRQAQIAARHALQQLAEGLRVRSAAKQRHAASAALHAAELQLPESWLPFVASR